LIFPMALYRYVKQYPKKKLKPPQVFSFGLIFTGVVIMLWVVWPIISFQVITASLLSKTISPLTEQSIARPHGGPVVMAASESDSTGELIDPNRWYPNNPQQKLLSPIDHYSLSIPKLKIADAAVTIAGDSLEKSLIHYGGTPLPGSNGTAVIFGHSTLPQLYDPKNYKAIFSLLPTLKPADESYAGDEIYLTYDSVTYKYIVYDMKIIKPTDLSVLDQQMDSSYLTLVTCVPPGTLWARLKVQAKLVTNQ
jgi:sortase A